MLCTVLVVCILYCNNLNTNYRIVTRELFANQNEEPMQHASVRNSTDQNEFGSIRLSGASMYYRMIF